MENYAHKLITLREIKTQSTTPSVIFGTANTLGRSLLQRSPVRIGLWPLVSSRHPNVSMGIMTLLGLLLERRSEIQAYRVFIKLNDDPTDYQWTPTDSQFGVDDWQLDDLDENVAIWGTFSQEDDKWLLELEVEIDDEKDAPNNILKLEAETLPNLVIQLPQIAQEIATLCEITTDIVDLDLTTELEESELKEFFTDLFTWQRHLLLSLWGWEWSADDIHMKYLVLEKYFSNAEESFATWGVANAMAHAQSPGYGDTAEYVSEILIKNYHKILNPVGIPSIAYSLYSSGYVQQGMDILSASVSDENASVFNWMSLANLQHRAGRYINAIKTYQNAIDANVTHYLLFNRYAQMLGNLDDNQLIDEFCIIDPDEFDDDYPIQNLIYWEAIEAYEKSLSLNPQQPAILANQLVWLIQLQASPQRLWRGFEQLITIDTDTGDYVRDVLDEMFDFVDIEPAIDLLKKAVNANGSKQNPFLRLNLAYALVIDEQDDDAIDILETLRETTAPDNQDIMNEIERLLLMIDDPEFELKLTELGQIVDTGKALSLEDVDYLENIIDLVPTLSEPYIVLAKAYQAWEEVETVLETLMDGHAAIPEDPDITELLAKAIWESGDHELALQYLQKGLETSPNHVPILALMGQYLVDEDYIDTAKAYLARAELISPRHPSLAEAKRQISQSINAGKLL